MKKSFLMQFGVLVLQLILNISLANAVTLLPGDINGDEKIDTVDVTYLQQVRFGNLNGVLAPENILFRADLTRNGDISSLDITYMIRATSNIVAGDLNMDGNITVKDAILLRSALLSGSAPVNCDLNADSVCNSLDFDKVMLIISYSGDVDGDGSISWRDTSLLQKVAAGLLNSDPNKDIITKVGDVTRNGTVSSLDASRVLVQIIGKGDISGDGVLSSVDASMALDLAAGKILSTNSNEQSYMIASCDLNNDGKCSRDEAMNVVKKVQGAREAANK